MSILSKNTVMRNKTFDDIAGASIVLSLKKLKNSYSGPCLKLRRSSDNAEQDFWFDSNNILDTTSISTWLSTDTAYIVKWYDQSGWNNNAVQYTQSKQPTLDTNNLKITFTAASGTFLSITDNSSIHVSKDDFTYITEIEFNTTSGFRNVFMKGGFSSPRNYTRFLVDDTENLNFSLEDVSAPEEVITFSIISTGVTKKYIGIKEGTYIKSYENITLQNSLDLGGSYGSLTNTSDLYIGANTSGIENFHGNMKNFILLRKALDSKEIDLVNNI